ncbi:MAG TPA: cyclic nucleotide-binding domain-containing protein [Streptosporangiaceae bacterium]|nr:cyclic nucleotide-binding domain-containing protein [Streptosporangiaceae bacterium]
MQTLSCVAVAAAALIASGFAAGTLGVVITGLLAVIAIPIAGFTRNQVMLANKGREMARTVDDVLSLMRCDAAAFARPFAARHGPAEEQAGQPSLRARHPMDAQPAPSATFAVSARTDVIGPQSPERATAAVANVHPRRIVHTRRDHCAVQSNATGHEGHSWAHAPRQSFWQSLTPAERQGLTALGYEKTFAAGAVLCHEDEPARHLMVLRTGWTKVEAPRTGSNQVIARRGPGDIIGERAVFQVRSRSATVTATSTVRALIIAAEEFQYFLDDHPSVLEVLDRQVYQRLTERHRPWLARTASNIGQRLASRASPPTWAGQNCSILFTDITAFGAASRNDEDRRTVRNVVYRILREAFESSNVAWEGCYREDRGDGALIIIPAQVPTSSIVDPYLGHLATALRRHNHQASQALRIQLRLALHVGPVIPDAEGVSGESVIFAARLLDAAALKKELANSGADLGFIASTFVYDTVIKHGLGSYLGPASYRQVKFCAKGTKVVAWMYLTGTRKILDSVLGGAVDQHPGKIAERRELAELLPPGRWRFRPRRWWS